MSYLPDNNVDTESIFVSVIVPVFNTPQGFLKPSLDSLSLQTLRSTEFEIIVVDDGSTHSGTVDLVDEFVDKVPNAHLVRHRANQGLNAARRSGRRKARGTHILFVDSDDLLARDAVEALWKQAGVERADIVMGTKPVRWQPETLSLSAPPKSDKSYFRDWDAVTSAVFSAKISFTMCGRLFRADVVPLEVFDIPDHTVHEDVATLPRILLRARSVCHTEKTIYFYSSAVDGSITNIFSETQVDGIFYGLRDWAVQADLFDLSGELRSDMDHGVMRLTETLVRRCLSSDLAIEDKVRALRRIGSLYLSLPRLESKRGWWRLKFRRAKRFNDLAWAPEDLCKSPEEIVAQNEEHFMESRSGRAPQTLERIVGSSSISQYLSGAIVIICMVDYHLRIAAAWARELKRRGFRTVILDNSKHVVKGRRALRPEEEQIFEGIERLSADKTLYEFDSLATARVVLTFNDFNDLFREALEVRNLCGLPTVAVVEGINDFLRVDADTYRELPYRKCETVFLAGRADESYFADRKTRVVGMPIIEELLQKPVRFPDEALVAINVNFSYGILENSRDSFVSVAVDACRNLNLDYAITQHPMDEGDLSQYSVTDKTQYELIADCSVFVSRFATGILEALASGKPVVYFNPHGERVPKFSDPMGAFQVARTREELQLALQKVLDEIGEGVDFRKRARLFLEHHAGLDPSLPTLDRAVGFIEDIAQSTNADFDRVSALTGAGHQGASLPHRAAYREGDALLGPFSRDAAVRVHETDVVNRLLDGTGRDFLLLDVGAHIGNALSPFARRGWRVIACEPDPDNRSQLQHEFGGASNVVIDPRAVSDTASTSQPFFASDESSGISSLRGFRDSHQESALVDVTTVRDLISEHQIEKIDFLKIDVEGFDFHVLKGVPWNSIRPSVVVCEFEDHKTKPLGYSWQDMAEYLTARDYAVYISEWHPIVTYGMSHEWCQLARYPSQLNSSDAWGNLIAFDNDPGPDLVSLVVTECMNLPLGSSVSGRQESLISQELFKTGEALRALDSALEQSHADLLASIGRFGETRDRSYARLDSQLNTASHGHE